MFRKTKTKRKVELLHNYKYKQHEKLGSKQRGMEYLNKYGVATKIR